jgi:hypothetical protein
MGSLINVKYSLMRDLFFLYSTIHCSGVFAGKELQKIVLVKKLVKIFQNNMSLDP